MAANRTTQKTPGTSPARILLIEEDPKEVRQIRRWLTAPGNNHFSVEAAGRLSSGLKRLSVNRYELVLLNLTLPDSSGMDTLHRVRKQAPHVPIIVQTHLDDDAVAVGTVKQGAQDFLPKSQMDAGLLSRSIRYAIERQRLLEEIRNLSLVDELTGLHNRRGFTTLAENRLKLAKRAGERMHLLFIDLDHLKKINDRWGHTQGDEALRETARILRQTFRESDVLARVGGDEFCVLARECRPNSSRVLTARLRRNLKERNRQADSRYRLSVSLGVVHSDPGGDSTPSDLLHEADRLMYRHKRNKKNASR